MVLRPLDPRRVQTVDAVRDVQSEHIVSVPSVSSMVAEASARTGMTSRGQEEATWEQVGTHQSEVGQQADDAAPAAKAGSFVRPLADTPSNAASIEGRLEGAMRADDALSGDVVARASTGSPSIGGQRKDAGVPVEPAATQHASARDNAGTAILLAAVGALPRKGIRPISAAERDSHMVSASPFDASGATDAGNSDGIELTDRTPQSAHGVDVTADASPRPRLDPDAMELQTHPKLVVGEAEGSNEADVETDEDLAAVERRLNLGGDALDLLMAPGDIIAVRGRGGLAQIGTAGGFVGHVMVVLRQPVRVLRQSPEAHNFASVWPTGDVREIWRVRTVESTRREAGLWEADMILFVDPTSRELILGGEVELGGDVFSMDHEPVELWQSPEPVRSRLQLGLMRSVLEDMRACQANWNAFTAARAVMKRAIITADTPDKTQAMDEIRSCWATAPICTSVAIAFWQRYLCKVAHAPTAARAWVEALSGVDALCFDLIVKNMPLKADRGLPGELLSSMQSCGWVQVQSVPRIFQLLPAYDVAVGGGGYVIKELAIHSELSDNGRGVAL